MPLYPSWQTWRYSWQNGTYKVVSGISIVNPPGIEFCLGSTKHLGGRAELVVPHSLQMGWFKYPSYFCATLEMVRDLTKLYIKTQIGSQQNHKFLPHTKGNKACTSLMLAPSPCIHDLKYLVEIYMDNFLGLTIPTSSNQLNHVANSIMCAFHDMFPPDDNGNNKPISLKNSSKVMAHGTQ